MSATQPESNFSSFSLYEMAILLAKHNFEKEFKGIDLTALPEDQRETIVQFRISVLNSRLGQVDERFNRQPHPQTRRDGNL